MAVVNITARVLVVLVGVAILGDIRPFTGFDSPLQEVLGIAVILFGILRLLTYLTKNRRGNDQQ